MKNLILRFYRHLRQLCVSACYNSQPEVLSYKVIINKSDFNDNKVAVIFDAKTHAIKTTTKADCVKYITYIDKSGWRVTEPIEVDYINLSVLKKDESPK